MGLVLYDHPVSSNALKVRILLAELDLPYAREEIPLSRPRPPAYLARNPLGGVPALEDGALFLTESNAILRYLADREEAVGLYPREPAARARVDELLDRFSQTLRPALFRVERAALGYTPAGGFGSAPPDLDAAAREGEAIAETMAAFDRGLDDGGGDGRPLCGVNQCRPVAASRRGAWPVFTIAGCAAAPALWRTLRTGLDLGPYPRLARWRDALVARPSFAAAGPVG